MWGGGTGATHEDKDVSADVSYTVESLPSTTVGSEDDLQTDHTDDNSDLFMTFAEIPSGEYIGRESDNFGNPHSWFPFENESGDGSGSCQFYLYPVSGDEVIIGNIDITPDLVTNRGLDFVTVEGNTDGITYEITFARDGSAQVTAVEDRTGIKISDTFYCSDGTNSAAQAGAAGSDDTESLLASYEGVVFRPTGHGLDGTTIEISLSKNETVFTLHYVYSIDNIEFDDIIRVDNKNIKDTDDDFEINETTSDSGTSYQMRFSKDSESSTRIIYMTIFGKTSEGIYIEIESGNF